MTSKYLCPAMLEWRVKKTVEVTACTRNLEDKMMLQHKVRILFSDNSSTSISHLVGVYTCTRFQNGRRTAEVKCSLGYSP